MLKTVWTIGHSNRDFPSFVELLRISAIEVIADVRRFDGSARNPQFGRDALAPGLAEAGIGYVHFPEMGGRRGRPVPDSPNTGWKVAAFNAFADHMATPEFTDALGRLEAMAAAKRTAIMCSEAVPWRCHRRLIADALTLRGWDVRDILGKAEPKAHRLTPFTETRDGVLVYPAPAESQPE